MKKTICAVLAALALQACGDAGSTSERAPQPLLDASGSDRVPAATVDNPFTNDVSDNVAAVDSAETADMTPYDGGGATTTETPSAILPAAPSSTRSCSDGKRVCRDMDDCEDAVFHLEQCGMSRLDGDSDGTPCEKICG